MSREKTITVARLIVSRSCLSSALVLAAASLSARAEETHIRPGNLLISRSVYDNNSQNVVPGVTLLPAGCTANAPGCVLATASGVYPDIWNNEAVDPSFGITSKIFLDQITPTGAAVNSLEVPNSAQKRVTRSRDQMVTSFPSKSEIALNLSTDGRYVTFMGYYAPVDALDVSNSNTPAVFDSTNPVPSTYLRVVAALDQDGEFHFTATNAYSGNNGRAAILNRVGHSDLIYTAGNAGNGGNPQPNGVIIGAGAQILQAEKGPLAQQNPGLPTPVGSFNITQLGDKADKIGKDTNFRGLTIFKNTLFYTKGSGGNGVNTVYFVDTSGFDANGAPLACPNGVGLPNPSASLPTAPLAYDGAVLQSKGLTPNNMCILKGFPTALKTKTDFPFGIWFANATTLYVADEGDGTTTFDATKNTYTAAAASPTAGLQKWVFDAATSSWKRVYTLQSGLALGAPYTVVGYPTGSNAVTNLPWSPATDGLRNITGRVNRDGTATIWAITSTVSGSVDQGADPNKLVMIVDDLKATTLPVKEAFTTVRTAGFAEVLRGVSFTPGTNVAVRDDR